MRKALLVVAALMILFGSIVASQAEEKQNGLEGGGAPAKPTTTAPKPVITAPKKPVVTAPKPVKCTPPPAPPPGTCPPSAASCQSGKSCCVDVGDVENCITFQTSTPAQCLSGYFGPSCAACPGGASAPCSSHGTCSEGIAGSGVCTCSTGFSGAACQSCAVNYYGANCTFCLAASTCNGNGTCSGENGACICQTGYFGSSCASCAAGYTGPPCVKTPD